MGEGGGSLPRYAAHPLCAIVRGRMPLLGPSQGGRESPRNACLPPDPPGRFSKVPSVLKDVKHGLERWKEFAPAILDNYMTRSLLGRYFMHCRCGVRGACRYSSHTFEFGLLSRPAPDPALP